MPFTANGPRFWAPLKQRIFALAGRGDSTSDTGSFTSHSGSSSSRTRFGSSRSSVATLCGRDYPLSPELVGFLDFSSSRGERISGDAVIAALRSVARDDERRRAACKLKGNASQQLASLLQAVCPPCLLRLLSHLTLPPYPVSGCTPERFQRPPPNSTSSSRRLRAVQGPPRPIQNGWR